MVQFVLLLLPTAITTTTINTNTATTALLLRLFITRARRLKRPTVYLTTVDPFDYLAGDA